MQRVLLDPTIDRVLATTAQMLGLSKATVTTIVLVGLPMMAWLAETEHELRARLFAASRVTLPERIDGLYARMASNPAIRRAAVEDYVTSFGRSLDTVHREAAAHAGTTERQARDVLAASLPAVTQVLTRTGAGRGEQGFATALQALRAEHLLALATRETAVNASGHRAQRSTVMAKELSEQLADLSTQARKVEEAFAAIAEETDAKAAERRDKTRAAAAVAIDHLEQGVASVEDSVSGHWRALQHKVQSEVSGIQEGIAERQHARSVEQAQQQAAAAEIRAERAVAFAAAAIQTAGLAVLDSGVARREAEAIARG